MRRSLVMAANIATTAAVRPTVIFLHGSGDTGRGVEGWLRSLAPPDALAQILARRADHAARGQQCAVSCQTAPAESGRGKFCRVSALGNGHLPLPAVALSERPLATSKFSCAWQRGAVAPANRRSSPRAGRSAAARWARC